MRIAVDDQYNADLGYKAVLMSLCEALLMFYLYRREMHERLRFQTLWNSAMDVATNNALLHNLLPAPICRRVQAGETVLDERDNIPVLFAQVATQNEWILAAPKMGVLQNGLVGGGGILQPLLTTLQL